MIHLRGVAVTYPGPPPLTALHPCELSITDGEFVAVVGPSGSGKSTLLNVLGLLDRPTVGTYELDGVDTSRISESRRTDLRAQRMGFIFQAFHLLPHRTARENVMLALLYQGVHPSRRRVAAAEVLDRVGLGHRAEALPSQLSGGERQRVAIARALVAGPSLLLCDEPTGNLDSENSDNVLGLIRGLRDDRMTIVMITHDAHVAGHADRVITIRDGVLG